MFSAGLPDRIRCPHCKCRLRYDNAGGVVVFLLLALACIAYPTFVLSTSQFFVDLGSRSLVFPVLLLVAWVPVEWAAVRFLRERRRLIASGS